MTGGYHAEPGEDVEERGIALSSGHMLIPVKQNAATSTVTKIEHMTSHALLSES